MPDRPGKEQVLQMFDNARINGRNLAMPVEWYLASHGFAERNDAYLAVGMELVEDAARQACASAGIEPRELTGVLFVSTTGLATPSIEVRLANRLSLSPDLLRVPIWGLGCAGGVAGIARAADLARAYPTGHFLVVALELCSLSFDIGSALADGGAVFDKKTMASASLFSDGCAALVVSGDEAKRSAGGTGSAVGAGGAMGAVGTGRRGTGADQLRLIGTASHLWPDTERVMGWDVRDTNLDVVLSPRIPDIVREHMPALAAKFLASHQTEKPDHWLLHPGGAKVVDAFREALGLSVEDLDATSAVLLEHGNMSSPTVLFVLDRAWESIGTGERAFLAALGPGFCAELALVERPA